jgi:hypothetical protein
MKKLLSLLLVGICGLSLAGCKANKDQLGKQV